VASPPALDSRRRRRRSIAVGTAILFACLLIVGGVGLAVAWHFSNAVLVPNHSGWQAVDVEAVSAHRIVLERSEEAERPGTYGLLWRGGHAIVGPVLSADEDKITRRLRAVDGYLVPGKEAWLDTDLYPGDPRQALGLPFSTVAVAGELGPMAAWVVRPAARRRGDWAIVVHGINGDLQEGLRLVPALRRVGLTSMQITYRDDPGAPESPDGLHHLGMTEWRDLEAAARYALGHGAHRLVLVGYSMGAAIVAQFMERSALAPDVSALIFDAPVLDWRRVLEFNATQTGFPAPAANPLEWAIAARIDVDWSRLDALEHSTDFHLPILLFHGTDDELVPIDLSEQFAAELPRWVTLYAVPGAGHTQSWNVDHPLYERRMEDFLDSTLETDRARPKSGSS
jgi:alpha-beta hydrolase superfamily lysophospholipase